MKYLTWASRLSVLQDIRSLVAKISAGGVDMNLNEDKVRAIWRSADAVCLDVDSTVCVDEGIDELAAFMGVKDKVSYITNEAMSGVMTFKESLQRRLNIIHPSRQNMTQFITYHPPRLTDGVRELVNTLHSRNVPVFLVSGGFFTIIELVAEELNIPKGNIFANKLMFYYNGEYAGFDENLLTCEAGGKGRVIQQLKQKYGYQRLVHIGDGATDAEACPPADAFIGFGGNKVRESVRQQSAWYIMSFQELLDELHRKMMRVGPF